jgi:hypothetical protein
MFMCQRALCGALCRRSRRVAAAVRSGLRLTIELPRVPARIQRGFSEAGHPRSRGNDTSATTFRVNMWHNTGGASNADFTVFFAC